MFSIGHKVLSESIAETERRIGLSRDAAAGLIASLHIAGGFTYSINGESTPAAGYAVSLFGREEIHDLRAITPAAILRYIAGNLDALQCDGNYFGAWVDGSRVYLDVSTITPNRDAAITLGRINEQLAIYDLEGGNSIRL